MGILKASPQRVTDDQLLSVLEAFPIQQNSSRKNVTPEGDSGVQSETFGIVTFRSKAYEHGRLGLGSGTIQCSSVVKLINLWIKGHQPPDFQGRFPWTSITVNTNFAAKRHRDKGNWGPALIKTFGKFTGGDLLYWPEDRGTCDVDELESSAAIRLCPHHAAIVFDGNRAHEVAPYKGSRYSIVAYCHSQYERVAAAEKSDLRKLGFAFPTSRTMQAAQQLCSPTSLNPKP